MSSPTTVSSESRVPRVLLGRVSGTRSWTGRTKCRYRGPLPHLLTHETPTFFRDPSLNPSRNDVFAPRPLVMVVLVSRQQKTLGEVRPGPVYGIEMVPRCSRTTLLVLKLPFRRTGRDL